METSPFILTRALERHVSSILNALDLYSLPAGEQRIINLLKNELIDARLDTRDYELSETRAEQLTKAKEAQGRLEQIRKRILTASEYNVFSAVDVAQLTAQLEQIIGYIE